MSAPGTFSPDWLALREPADAAARAVDLLGPLRAHLAARADGPLVVRDLGCGTGSMHRWLAGWLPGPQRWILHDRDPGLLARASASVGAAAETREGDITSLTAADLAGTSLVTASALLDLLTGAELDRLAAAITGAGRPALLALSVTGRVELTPPDPFDAGFAAAFNAHQRRGARLGPAAPDAAARAFERRGATVWTSPSPWRLGPERAALTAEWLRGWVGAAVEESPGLPGETYLRQRLDACAAGELHAVVHHRDLLVLPGAAS
ncbi:class I SAM-dependent methyltransferase [Spirillospora sp. NPDC029432]|uniref:class I SAM-dependent methyltransferase n=1 Tax=Spirillospora sp. NPDC029432 TaxID=3154599 RepID=UPI003451B4EB